MLLSNLIPITLIILILCAIFITLFIGIQANKTRKAYEQTCYYKDADENKPTFIRITDDIGTDVILNSCEIVSISKNKDFYKENREVYEIDICLSNDAVPNRTNNHLLNNP